MSVSPTVRSHVEAGSEASASTSHSHLHHNAPHVASTGGAPVRCPFCAKELPASLLLAPNGPSAQDAVNTQSLKTSETEAEHANTAASRVIISDDDLRRWSTLAGITVAPPEPAPAPIPPPPAQTKAVPLLAPPPKASPKSTTGKRFGLFSRNKSSTMVDDDDSDSDGVVSGYARLGAPEESDDGDDGYESDPIEFKPKPRPEPGTDPVKPEPEETNTQFAPNTEGQRDSKPGLKPADDELKTLLRVVLGRVQALTQSHNELQSSHTSLLTSLKIARSNLVMAEANTEMLEEELRRAKATAANAARTATPSTARTSVERPSIDTRHANAAGVGWFGKKKGPASPTDSTARTSGDAPRSPADEEVKRLKTRLETQADELEALKKGKKEIEAELEGLSQALFEEANKMVADERRRRAELEDSLKEVKGEREALRETVKVLGGRIATPPPIATPADEGDESPNLDVHYAALRRSIHHVVDGPTPGGSEPGTPPGVSAIAEEPGPERSNAAAPPLPGAFVPAPAFDSEPNPWAAERSPVAV